MNGWYFNVIIWSITYKCISHWGHFDYILRAKSGGEPCQVVRRLVRVIELVKWHLLWDSCQEVAMFKPLEKGPLSMFTNEMESSKYVLIFISLKCSKFFTWTNRSTKVLNLKLYKLHDQVVMRVLDSAVSLPSLQVLLSPWLFLPFLPSLELLRFVFGWCQWVDG